MRTDFHPTHNNEKLQQLHPVWHFLAMLRLPYKEFNAAASRPEDYALYLDLFGMRVRFNERPYPEDKGFNVFRINSAEDLRPQLENLMWVLVEKGVFAFLREELNDGERAFKKLLIEHGWGLKILDRRIELTKGDLTKRFTYERSQKLRKIPVPRLLLFNPGLFDYL